MLPKTTGTAAAGETTLCFQTINVDVDNTDIISIMIDGLAGDVAVNGTVRIWEDDYLRPVTAAQYNVEVTASGYVQAMLMRWLTDNAAGTPTALSASGYIQAMLMRWLTDNAVGTPNALVLNAVRTDAYAPASAVETILTGITSLANWLRAGLRKDAADVVAKAEINAGGGAYNEATDSQEALRDNVGTAGAGLTALGDARIANLDVAVSSRLATAGYSAAPTTVQINAALSAAHGAGSWGGAAGSGAITFTYTLTNAITHLPIADADVWVTSDAAGANVLATGRTNQFGRVVFYLDAGTVYVWRQKSGWDFSNPDTEVVT